MSLEEMKARIQRAGEEAWLRGNLDALDDAYAEDYLSYRPPLPNLKGLQAVKDYIAGARDGYSDVRISYEDWIGEGNSIAYRYEWRAKHTGRSATLPIPPTGKDVTLQGCVVVHIKDGKVVEEFEYSDYLGFLQQLGVVPPLG